MSKDIKNIEEKILSQIQKGEIKMKPRMYFVIGSIFAFVGFISTIIVSTFAISLIRFSLRAHGKMAQYRLDQVLSDFPWWIFIVGFLSLVIGIWLIYKYHIFYKIKPWIVILTFVLSIMISGWIINETGLDTKLFRQGPMKGLMRKYIQRNNISDISLLRQKINRF